MAADGAEPPARNREDMAHFTASTVGDGRSLRHEVDVNGRHLLVTDEPELLGGSDAGPAPHELLPAALAACISTTVAIYAQRRQWDLGEIRVDVDYESDAEPRHFAVTLELPGDLTHAQVERLRRVAETCPVRRALESACVIEERVAVGALAA